MASTAMTAANGATTASNSSTPPSSTPATGSGRAQFKITTGSRPDAGNRRQSGSPMDTTQRRSSALKPWATNPITQRPSNYNQQNGSISQPKSGAPKAPTTTNAKETNTPDKHANDRLLFLLANFLGRSATVTVKNGDIFTGVFTGSSVDPTEPAYVLKMVKHIKSVGSNEQSNGVKDSGYVGTGAEHVMIFELRDVVDLFVETISFNDMTTRPQNGVSSTFRIDADIGGNAAARQRDLQPWSPGEDADGHLTLEGNAKTKSPSRGAEWDQFEANERLYGVKSDYDENLYTTTIDRTNPLYEQRAAAAERIAREIENASTMNSHVAEERGIILGDDSGMDEEDKYSGVQRKTSNFPPLQPGQTNKYTPPARRPPTGQPTVPGAPVDPAIISSQLARPETTANRAPQEKQTVQASRRQTPPPSQPEQVKSAPTNAIQKPTMQPAESTMPSIKAVPTIKGPTESTQNQPSSGPPIGTNDTSPTKPKPTVSGTGVPNVEYEVRDAFRQFANQEKMRFQEHRRNQAKHDKNIKLNDLMKFSQNFKLNTPVPKDLIPILAKDKNKQEEIMERARKAAEEKSQNPTATNGKSTVALTEQRTQRPLAAPKFDAGGSPAHALPDRQNFTGSKPGYPQQRPYNTQSLRADRSLQGQTIPVRSGPGLSHRLANIQLQNKAGATLPGVPSPVPIQEPRLPPTGPAISTTDIASAKSSGAPTPTSALSTKFNAKALEFKPMSFTPTGNSTSAASSPRPVNQTPPASRVSTPPNFFGARKPLSPSERPSINDFFNPIKRARREADTPKEDDKSPDRRAAYNGIIKPAYKTPPTWDVAEENKDKSYTEMFDKVTFSTQPISSPQPSHVNPQLPHQHQLPFHLQHGGQGVPPPQAPPQTQHHLHAQPHHHPVGPAPHYDDHRIHVSSPPSVLPSPHLQTANLAYPSPMARGAQLMYGQHVPQYAIGPNGPQMAQFGQYPGVPQFVPQQGGQVGAPMMAHGPSGGPFMIPHVPFGQMYSPGQVHAYPQHGPPPPPVSTGYPSPSRGAPMMMHQGSQQGQPSLMIGMSPGQHVQPIYAPQIPMIQRGYPHPQQPQFGTSPHQSHHYPPRAGPVGNYGPLPPSGPHVANQQPPTQPQSHQPDGGDDK
ncbi:hypothetical protein FGG08_001875 [Glutinoglossum americanum]|uniref:LsmAD domain-containing protein n=1 Tax=Glutinoglossum americanum TaxID=1670608 RepID=A0A9P8I7D8_9PEZI|nr:hypothetical protein FGG08_001875 [Glutinoglossum americanum]